MPANAVPQADDDHGGHLAGQDNEGGRRARLAAQQAAREGRKDVEPGPIAEGDVPALPEFGDVAAQVGAVEVFGQLDAEQQAEADGDVGVAAEVEVEAQGVAVEQQPQPGGVGDLADVGGVEGHALGQGVGDDEFFEEAEGDAAGGEGHPAGVTPTPTFHRRQGAKIAHKTFGTVDGAGHEAGKEDDVGNVFAQGEFRQEARLPVAGGVDEAKGDVGEAEPVQVDGPGQAGVLASEAAPPAADQGGQRFCLEEDEEGGDEGDEAGEDPPLAALLQQPPQPGDERAAGQQGQGHEQGAGRARGGEAVVGGQEAVEGEKEDEAGDDQQGQAVVAGEAGGLGAARPGEVPTEQGQPQGGGGQDEVAEADGQGRLQPVDGDDAAGQQGPAPCPAGEQGQIEQGGRGQDGNG